MNRISIKPHQQRVIDEKQELDIKAAALSKFIGKSDIFDTLSDDEKLLMREQCELMWSYSEVIGKRICLFK